MRRGLAVLALAATALASLPLAARPAAAVSAPVSFSAASLSTWQTNGVVWATASAQGLVFAGGTFTRIRPPGQTDTITTNNGTSVNPADLERVNLAVFDAATGAPVDCSLPVTGTTSTVRSLAVSPDGSTLYIGGFFTAVGGLTHTNIASIDISSCTVNDSWKAFTTGYVFGLAVSPTTVYAGGGFTAMNGQPRTRIAALNAYTGVLVPGFTAAMDGTSHDGIFPNVNALALKPDFSALVVGGNFDQVNGASSHALAVVDPTSGATLKAFPGLITGYTSSINHGSAIKALAVDSTGFYTGNEGSGRYIFDGRLAINWDYTVRWQDNCLGANQALLVYNSLLYIGGHSHDCTSIGAFGDGSRHHLLAESTQSSTPTLQGWTPDTNDGIGEGVGPRALTLASVNGTDYLWLGGEFTSVNNNAQQGLARFSTTDTSVGQAAGPILSVSSTTAGKVTIAVRTGFDSDDRTLTYSLFRDGSATPAFIATQSSFSWDRPQVTFTDTQPAGSSHTYKVVASDGLNTSASPVASVVVSGTTSSYGGAVAAAGPLFQLRYDDPAGQLISDSSGNNNSFRPNTTTSMTWRAAGALAGDPSTSVAFNGTSASYAVSENRFTAPTAFTLETWFKTTTTVGGKLIGFTDSQQLESQDYDTRNPDLHIADKLIYMTNSGKLIFGTEGTPNSKQTLATTSAYNDGAWHLVAATQGSAGMTLYVDGKQIAHNSITTNGGGTGFWRIGGDSIDNWPSRPTSNYFKGSFDETAVYPSALSAADVSRHYVVGHPAARARARQTAVTRAFFARELVARAFLIRAAFR